MIFNWKQIRNEIDIAASPELVWDILVDVSLYRTWNPFLVQVQGRIQAGSYLELTMALPGDTPREKKVQVTSLDPCREFSWKGTKIHPVILGGYNRFRLIPLSENEARLIQEETFSGALVPFCSTWIDQCLSVGYNNMLIALKSKVEGQVHNYDPVISPQGTEKRK